MEKDPDIKMPRRSTNTKKSEIGTRRKMQQKTLEELESRKLIECRCSPVSIFTTINSLTKEQKLEVDKMGFSSMKAIQDWKINRRLFIALAKAYNTTTSKLELVVGDIDVTTDKIGLALGLPSIGKSFPEEEDWTSEQKRLVAPFKSVTSPWLQEIIYYHKDIFGDKENYMGPPPPWIAYWDKEKLAKKLTQESSKQRPMGIVTLLVKQDDVIKPEWREIVQSAVQAFLEIEDCDIYIPSPIKKT
ncbi:hypothetical protein Ahy_B01g052058 [Arachis hypogaea]|uniref:Uncharacterized protein n=1 Tax=Arachis hypogaea TaxID=3818 RepID=A0A445ANN9_ARAHY|nr:hypothetical protein Ahy_B01g052058 [Arachis hypogaea]